MSHANLYVRFPDGTLRYGIYYGTADVAMPELHRSTTAAWTAYRDHDCQVVVPLDPPDAVPVDIATDYGGGFAWRGHATRDVLVVGRYPDGLEAAGGLIRVAPAEGYTDGLPDWAVEP